VKQRQKKEAVINSVPANDNRFNREKARRDSSSTSIIPPLSIASHFTYVEKPNRRFICLMRILLKGDDDAL